jgi:hypothetical protein
MEQQAGTVQLTAALGDRVPKQIEDRSRGDGCPYRPPTCRPMLLESREADARVQMPLATLLPHGEPLLLETVLLLTSRSPQMQAPSRRGCAWGSCSCWGCGPSWGGCRHSACRGEGCRRSGGVGWRSCRCRKGGRASECEVCEGSPRWCVGVHCLVGEGKVGQMLTWDVCLQHPRAWCRLSGCPVMGTVAAGCIRSITQPVQLAKLACWVERALTWTCVGSLTSLGCGNKTIAQQMHGWRHSRLKAKNMALRGNPTPPCYFHDIMHNMTQAPFVIAAQRDIPDAGRLQLC